MPSVLITGFNRPSLLSKAIHSVLEAKGLSNLYIHIDGPRENHPSDVSQVKACQSLVVDMASKINIRYYFQDCNLGCEKGMQFAIDWFFQQVESGVIIEDDIVIHPQALQIAELALIKYQHNPKVGQINLYNPIAKNIVNKELRGYFIDYPIIWGWACWKDRWGLNLNFRQIKLELTLKNLEINKRIGLVARRQWFKKIIGFTDRSNTWDIPWLVTCWSHQLISLSFSHSLTTNIGDGPEATHTKKLSDLRLAPLSEAIFDLTKIQFPDKVFTLKRINKKVSSRVWDLSLYKIVTYKIRRVINNWFNEHSPRKFMQ